MMRIQLKKIQKDSETSAFAADELVYYLTAMLPGTIFTYDKEPDGADLTIRLDVPETMEDYGMPKVRDSRLDDQYYVEIGEHTGVIAGVNGRSLLIAVYQYLRRLGCRFLRPGRKYEVIPILSGPESLRLHMEETASLRHRGVCIEGANSLENVLDFVDWLPKLGYNEFFLQFQIPYTFFARWYHHELNPYMERESYDPKDARRDMLCVTKEMKRRELMLHSVGHGWTGEAIGYSSSQWKPSDQALDERQKAMTAMVGGKRGLFMGIPMDTNLCYSNPEARNAFIDQVVAYAGEHPETEYLHVWLADEYNNVCECEDCRRKNLADQYISILNEVDERLTREGLAVKLVFLLYQELLWPPKEERFHHPERFVLMFAPISRTFDAAYEIKDQYGKIPEYHRNKVKLPVNLDENMVFLKAWQSVFSGDGFVYDYPLGRAHYGDFGYLHISRIISKDIGKIKEMGLDGYVSCQELRAAFPNALPNYVMGSLLFDSHMDYDALTAEYYQSAYGDGWERVYDYLSKISSLCSCDYFNGKGERVNGEEAKAMENLLETVREFRDVIACGVASHEGLEKIFWKHLDYHADYSLRLGKALYEEAKGHRKAADACFAGFQELICKREEEFQECLDVYRITEVASKYAGFGLDDVFKQTL